MTREDFIAQFGARTLAYCPGFVDNGSPLVIRIGERAHSVAGHALLLSLANMVARAHRRIIFTGNVDVPLLCRDIFGLRTLEQATAGLATAINPLIDVDVGPAPQNTQPLLAIGVGADASVDVALGCDGWLALLDDQAPVGQDPTSIWGGLLAACLGANVALHRVLGEDTVPHGTFSLWDYGRASRLDGPSVHGPLDVGRVLQVGAGAVGSALDFFLGFFGAAGLWRVIDPDRVDVTNLNRQLLYTARDAGFPHGGPENKACRTVDLLGPPFQATPDWYSAEAARERTYDVTLALANERGVRSALQHRQPTALLHATTSMNWQAQIHRHVAGHDDCIDCRLPAALPAFQCATEPVHASSGKISDAAIPPLSALAGLLLLAELVKLQKGELVSLPHNFSAVDLYHTTPKVQRVVRRCREGCTVRLAPGVRQRLDASSRWVGLDADIQTE